MKRLLRILLPAGVAAVSLIGAALPAYAGTNGQQIRVYESSNVASLCISGYNQNASFVSYCFTAPANIYNTDSYSGYWWKTYFGTVVALDYYGASNWTNYVGSNTCDVPEYRSESNWWQCNSV